jgi:hypothetical protein
MICANKECLNGKEFIPKTHNQKYCSDECCRIATNRRIMEKYYEKKAIRNGASRICKKCKTKLSRYNQNDVCSTCEKNVAIDSRNAIWSILNELS